MLPFSGYRDTSKHAQKNHLSVAKNYAVQMSVRLKLRNPNLYEKISTMTSVLKLGGVIDVLEAQSVTQKEDIGLRE